MEKNTTQHWQYLEKILEQPPNLIIEKKLEHAKNMNLLKPHTLHMPATPVLRCTVCYHKLCDTITEKVKNISKVICKCDTLWIHNDCVQKYTNKSSQCNVCKEYFIICPLQTSLRSSIVDLM